MEATIESVLLVEICSVDLSATVCKVLGGFWSILTNESLSCTAGTTRILQNRQKAAMENVLWVKEKKW